jgi:hypothetical protein
MTIQTDYTKIGIPTHKYNIGESDTIKTNIHIVRAWLDRNNVEYKGGNDTVYVNENSLEKTGKRREFYDLVNERLFNGQEVY